MRRAYDPQPFVKRKRYRAYSYPWWQRVVLAVVEIIAVAAVAATTVWVVR